MAAACLSVHSTPNESGGVILARPGVDGPSTGLAHRTFSDSEGWRRGD